jgi:hypothetical protein
VLVRAQINSTGGLELEAVSATDNLDQIHPTSGFDLPLLLPRVQVQLGTQVSTLDTSPVDRALMARRDRLVSMLQLKLKQFIETELPNRLSNMAFDRLQESFDTVRNIDSPGTVKFGTGIQLEWGLRPARVDFYSELIHVGLDGYVRDPLVTWDEQLPQTAPLLPPRLGGYPLASYDAALAVNAEIFNRAIALGYQRGAFNTQTLASGRVVRILRPPVFVPLGGNRAKLVLLIKAPRDGAMEHLAFESDFEVNLELHVRIKLVTMPNGMQGFQLISSFIDTATANIPRRFISYDSLVDDVEEGLIEELQEINAEYAATPDVLTAPGIELPSEILGIGLGVLKIETDANGYVVLYLEAHRGAHR